MNAIVFDALHVHAPTTPQSFAFECWYGNHYLGGAAARRYLSAARGVQLAVIEGEAAPLGAHAAVRSVERYVCEPLGERRAAHAPPDVLEARILYAVFFPAPLEREAELNAWYDEEHMDMLLKNQYWAMCRRFRIRGAAAPGFTHLALHYLTDLRALESPERDAARDTPWRNRLAAEPWFRSDYRVYHRC